MAKSKRKLRGYQDGGSVGGGAMQGAKSALQMMGMMKTLGALGGGGAVDSGSFDMNKGGRINRTAGPKVGKEDGVIAAQKGEYVVRKAAVKKLGTKALETINRGKLPAKRMGR